ncbi:MAG TPA: glycerophosphodiester phosphodiesterase family protein, partial [Spirochaetota bacterium]|nr:glycerophosphodiester phosphodiesterase family protein [Spirochaetota bacterium]
MDSFLVIGHRGACGYEPENTLRSFEKAIALGAHMVELDVHRCRTGELVVIHDNRLERTTNGSGYVAEKTLDELRALDAGGGERIPLLREVVERVGVRAAINIELKGAGTAGPVSELIERTVGSGGYDTSHFLVSSFDHRELAR